MNRRPTALRRALAFAVALVAAGATALAVPRALAAVSPLVTVELTSVSLSGTQPTDRVQLQGRVSNPTGSVVYGLRLALWRSRDPLIDLESVRQATDEASPRGLILPGPAGWSQPIVGARQAFPAGASSDFTLTASLAELGFDTPGQAYLVGARALGNVEAGHGYLSNVGQAVTVLPVPGATAVPVTRLVVLSAAPTKLADGIFASEQLTADLQGRLGTLLRAAAAPGMSWLIDPALYDEVADQADGYQVLGPDSLEPGSGQQVAADWLARFRQLDPRAGARTVFALPDLSGAAAAHQPDVRTRAVAATTAVDLPHLPLVVLPTGGDYVAALDQLPSDLGPTVQLATNLETAGALQTTPDGRRLLASAVSLGSGASGFDLTQLVLAETLVAGPAGQLRVLREPDDMVADTVTTRPWMTPRLLGDLLASAPSATAAVTEATATPLSDDQFEAIDQLAQGLADYGELAPESAITDQSTAALTRAASSAWIAQPDGQAALVKSLGRLAGSAAMANAVTMDVSHRFVMSGRSARFPVTVTNHLAEPIRVKVAVTTDNPQRLTIPDTAVVSIPPGQSEIVTIDPEASANGIAIARVWVTTEEGRQITGPQRITIEMTDLGLVGWVIVIVSGLVVVGATALRLWQARRKAAAAAAPTPPDPPAPTPAATVDPSETADLAEVPQVDEPAPIRTGRPQDG